MLTSKNFSTSNLMKTCPDLNDRMRQILVDWLVIVCTKFNMNNYTLHLAICILDQYISRTINITRKEFQLVGIACLSIAAKLEEPYIPTHSDFVWVSANAFSEEQVYDTEMKIIETLDYDLMLDTLMTEHDKLANTTYHPSVQYYLDTALLSLNILYNFDNEDIVRSCMELAHHNAEYWSNCLDALIDFEKSHQFEEIQLKHGMRTAEQKHTMAHTLQAQEHTLQAQEHTLQAQERKRSKREAEETIPEYKRAKQTA